MLFMFWLSTWSSMEDDDFIWLRELIMACLCFSHRVQLFWLINSILCLSAIEMFGGCCFNNVTHLAGGAPNSIMALILAAPGWP